MKKALTIFTLAACVAGSIALRAAAYDNEEGIRIDYIDKSGKRISSDYPYAWSSAFTMQQEYDWEQQAFTGKWATKDNRWCTERLARMEFIPYGTESYPLTVKAAEDVTVKYEIIGEDNATRADGDVLCGTHLRYYITVPGGTYPTREYLNEYTNVFDGVAQTYTTYSCPANRMYPLEYPAFETPRFRDVKHERMRFVDDYYAGFIPGHVPAERTTVSASEIENAAEEIAAGRWTYDYYMENEPVSMEFGYTYAEGNQLRELSREAMWTLYAQYYYGNTFTWPFVNGEPFLMQMVGETFGNDYVSNLFPIYQMSGENLTNWTQNPSSTICWYVWTVLRSEITAANEVLTYMDIFNHASEQEKAVVRAEMLTLRANAYWRTLQIFAPRWQDSNNGETYCAPLELTFSTDNQPLSKMKDIIAQCYKDLDEAITNLPTTREAAEDIIMPTADVARGLKMRLALLCEDWATAQAMATEIVDNPNHDVSTSDDIKAGFFAPTRGWIWGAPNSYRYRDWDSGLYYWSFQSQNSCNGIYPSLWGYAPGAMDKDLYMKIPEGDVRKSLFIPDKLTYTNGENTSTLNVWSNMYRIMDETKLTCDGQNAMINNIRSVVGATYTPQNVDNKAYGNTYENVIPMQICGQLKFFSSTEDAANDYCVFMRVEEALLTLAEAAYHKGDVIEAQYALRRLNNCRNPWYTCDLQGDALLDEIRLQRRIELWGEGFSWFDFKRWNMPIKRRTGVKNDTSSGNWPADYPAEVATEAGNGWRWVLPNYVLNDNALIDPSLLGYKDVEYNIQHYRPAQRKAVKKAGRDIFQKAGQVKSNNKLIEAPAAVRLQEKAE